MKLFTRYNRINLLATVVIFLLAMGVFYAFLRQILVRQVDEDLEIEQTEIVTYVNHYHHLPEVLQQEDQQIFYTPAAQPITGNFYKTIPGKSGEEDLRELVFSVSLPEGWQMVRVSKSLEGTDHLTRSVVTIALLTIIIMLGVSYLVNRLVLQRLWKPFYDTLSTIQQFKIEQNEKLQLPENNIEEFMLMNNTLQQAMHKAGQDYMLLKEFTENASHELQKPLAVIRNKLEIVMQEPLSQIQSQAVESATDAVKLLSRFSRSLLVLSKIQNNQFADKSSLNLKTVIEKKLDSFREILEIKHLSICTRLENVTQLLNADLATMLAGNLLSNAVKHNYPGGKIEVTLTTNKLIISNTGTTTPIDTTRLFSRFYNPEKAINSTGLGLPIVKQICQVSGFDIQYKLVNDQHQFTVSF